MKWLLLITLIILTPNILSLEAQIKCPEKADFEEEFFCIVEVDSIDRTYDVKIYITAEGQGINRIWEKDNFRRADWYLKEAINKDGEHKFKLIIHKEFQGQAKGEFKLRDQNSRIITEQEFYINIETKEKTQKDNKKTQDIEEEIKEGGKENEENNESENNDYQETIQKTIEIKETRANQTIQISEKPLNLNNLEKTKENKIIYKSKNERIKDYMIYGFIFFLICVIGVLLYEKIW